jgi:hypothetical protein
MTEAEYRIKYLKYKQKYTNALHNMQGGVNQLLDEALQIQPDIVFVVKKDTYEGLRAAYGIAEESGSLEINSDIDAIKKGLTMVDENAIFIIPKKNFNKTETQSSITILGKNLSYGQNKQHFTGGIEKVNGKPAQYEGSLKFLQFGINRDSANYEYNGATAKTQLTDGVTTNYFTQKCGITDHRFLILKRKKLYFCMSND